jgi:hypothetical protein
MGKFNTKIHEYCSPLKIILRYAYGLTNFWAFLYFQAVEQSVKVIIPHQGKAIYESIKDIINGFSKILKNPKAALFSIGKGVFT